MNAKEAPLKWYEHVWCGLPLVLISFGGALGGTIGVAVMLSNRAIFRSNTSISNKYFFTCCISLMSVLIWYASATLVRAIFS